MKHRYFWFSSIALLVVLTFSICNFIHLDSEQFNSSEFIEESDNKIPIKDRMDLAWEQEFDLTKDPVTNTVPRERLLAAWQYQQILLKPKSLGKAAIPGVTWTERGPNNCGGRTRSVLVDMNDATKKTVWAGGAAGGLWKTTDITLSSPTWTPINDFAQNLAITHIDQAPNNGQVMYFCTGEGNGNLDAVRGLGVWKSTNGGTTWNQLAATNNSSYFYCQKVVSINNGDTMLVLTKTGLYRSINGGTSFTKVLGTGTSGSLGDIAYDLEIMNNGTMYVTMSNGSSTGGTIHKSFNKGATWTSPLTIPSYVNRDEMEIAVASNDTNVIYALVESASRIGAIIKSTNAGLTFDTVASHPIDADGGVSAAPNIKDFSRGQAWYDLSLAVDPNNSAVCVVGGIDLFKTTNGGGSWTQLSHWYGGFGFQEVHADQHYVYFEPGNSNVCYFSNDGSVYRSTNFTATNPSISSKESSYNTTQFYACDIHPNAGSNQYVAGSQDNGSHSFSTPGINSSIEVTGGDGAFCHIDQDQPNFWFTSYVFTSYYRSNNTGASFSNVLNTSVNVGSFISPTDYDDVANKMYLCGNNGTYVRWDNPQTGNTLVYDTVPLFNNGRITHVKVSPNTANVVFFGLNNGRIVRVSNAHITASIDSFINNGKGMPTGSVSCIEVETGNDNHIVATYSNYGVSSVWETKNGGFTWTAIEGNLPDMPVRWALFNPNKNWQLMIATELGVWTTDTITAATTNWAPSNTGFANVRTDMLKVRAFDKQVVAATHGRGLFTTNAFAPPFADFVVNKKLSYVSAFVNFTSTSNGASSYLWDFGDGTSSTLQNPTKQYLLPGFYSVTLSINGGLNTKTYNSLIQILPYRPTPYFTSSGGDFETNSGDFGAELVNGVGFVRGNSTTAGKNGTASGSNAWVTGLTGNYSSNNEAYFYSPSFNCTVTGTYVIRFQVKNKFELNYDGYIVEYSLNLGNTWTKLGLAVQTNWYDFSNSSVSTSFPLNEPYFNATMTAYTLKQFTFSSLAGNSKVAFRIVFKSDQNTNDVGMAIDNFEITGPNNAALPVNLLQFWGNRISQNEVNLFWNTATEKNNKGFNIERSTDGFNFSQIGFEAGKINSNELTKYNFNDQSATQDYLYYRLKQVDIDGAFSYSPIIRIDTEMNDSKVFSFSYGLNQNEIVVQGSSGLGKLKIINQNGQIVKQFNLVNQIEYLDLTELAKGIYLLEFTNDSGETQMEKLLWLTQ
jgi:PKD repeat protein